MTSNNPFHNFVTHNRSARELDFRILSDTGPLPKQDPVLLTNGKFEVPIIHPQDETRHTVLGIFMDEWSKLEMQIARLLAIALRADMMEMPVIMNGLGSRGQREALVALLCPVLTDQASAKLRELLDRFKTHTTRRNHIIHGYWHLEVVFTDRNGVPWPNYRQFRRYDPSDAEIRLALDKREDSAARKTYMFSLPRIRSISAEMERLWHDFSRISESDLKNSPKKIVNLNLSYSAPVTWVRA